MRKPAEIEIEFVATPVRWDGLAVNATGEISVFECKLVQSKKRRLDALKVRDEFLSIESGRDLAKFLSDTGQFVSEESRFVSLPEWQSLVRSLLSTDLDKWPQVLSATDASMARSILRYRNQMVHFPFDQGKSAVVIRATSTLEAIVSTMLADHLNGIRNGVCARVDCRKVFRLTTTRKRMFCTQYCGHLVSLRNKRRGDGALKSPSTVKRAKSKRVTAK